MDGPHLLNPDRLHAARNRGRDHRQHHQHLKVQQQRKHQLCDGSMPGTSFQNYDPLRDPLLSCQTPNNSNHTWTNTSTDTRTLSSTFLTDSNEANIGTSGSAIRHDTPGDDPREIGQFFIQSIDYPGGHFFVTPKPEEISHADPPSIKRPSYPEMRQHSLGHFAPCIFFVQYPCKTKCRSLGICVHYQFVIPCGKCPDGLICSECIKSTSPQEAISATRKCPLHQDANQPNPVNSRMEDFLATEAQKAACDEILLRSRNCQWEDIPVPPVDNGIGDDFAIEQDWSGREGERTPRTLDDVEMQMLDGTYEEEDAGTSLGLGVDFGPLDQTQPFQPLEQQGSITPAANDVFSFDVFGGPLGMQSWPLGLSQRHY